MNEYPYATTLCWIEGPHTTSTYSFCPIKQDKPTTPSSLVLPTPAKNLKEGKPWLLGDLDPGEKGTTPSNLQIIRERKNHWDE
jgi:hypothetical protein